MMDVQDIELLEIFYQAAGDRDAWLAAITTLAKAFHADHGHIVGGLREPGHPLFASVNLRDSDIARFQSDWAEELWKPFQIIMPKGRAVLQEEVISDRLFERSDFYNELVRPTGGFYGIFFSEQAKHDSLQLILCRAHGERSFDEIDSSRLNVLGAHIRHAYNLHRRLHRSEASVERLTSLIEHFDEGMLIISKTGEVELANARAGELIGDPAKWLAQARNLDAYRPSRSMRLVDLAQDIIRGSKSAKQKLFLRSPAGPQQALIVDMELLRHDGEALPGMSSTARLAIFIRHAEGETKINRRALMEFYGLTMRESEISAKIAEGVSLKFIAMETGLTINTVRFYLKQIFQKLGVKSQLELLSLIRSFAE